MKNVEQIRAANALNQKEAVRKQGDEGDILSGYPSLILNNGLLSALAFSLQKGKEQHSRIADAIAYHLAHAPQGNLAGTKPGAQALLEELTKRDSGQLRLCTAEALAFLSYLKRFAKKGD